MIKKRENTGFKIFAYIVLIFLALLSLFPFIIMIVNSTRSTYQIQQHALSLIPSGFLKNNWQVLTGKTFKPLVGFKNSAIISVCATACTVYFSTLTAYAIVAYNWKLKAAFFTVICGVMMIPSQVSSIGFYQFMYKIGMNNNLAALILPAIAAPMTVFFMRQYMLPNLPMEVLESARVDG